MSDESQIENRVVRQIEYYFGDFNLLSDKFMRLEIEGNDGWISLDTMLKFKRLASITTDSEKICNILREKSTFIEVNSAGDAIRRSLEHPIPKVSLQEFLNSQLDCTVYTKGFARDSNIEDIEKYFPQDVPILQIFKRPYTDSNDVKKFKGSVFVTFKIKEDGAKFLLDDSYSKYKGMPMIRKWKADYLTEKQNEKAQCVKEKAERKQAKIDNQRGFVKSKMTAGVLLELSQLDDDMPEQQRDDKIQNGQEAIIKSVKQEAKKDVDSSVDKADDVQAGNQTESKETVEGSDDNGKQEDHKAESENVASPVNDEELDRKKKPTNVRLDKPYVIAIKEHFRQFFPDTLLLYVGIKLSNKTAVLRFKDVGSAKTIFEKLDGQGGFKLKTDGNVIKSRVIEGDEEIAEWLSIIQDRSTRQKRRYHHGGGPCNKRRRK